MIYGLIAAFGWGLSDLWAAIAGRRMGSGRTVVVAQVAAAALVSLIVVFAHPDMSRLDAVIPWLIPNAFIGAAAFATLYRGLELGPIAVVSPVLASYAVVPVVLSVILLGESLGALGVAGVVVTISGAVLTSTDVRADVRALRSRTRRRFPGLPWAIASTLLFGVATYVMGWASKEAGFLPSLWFGRLSMMTVFLIGGLVVWLRSSSRPPEGPEPTRRAIGLAILVGAVELLGTVAYARGAEVGLVSIVTAASATYPLIPVFGGVVVLHERPAPNQYLGVALVVGGLVVLGAA